MNQLDVTYNKWTSVENY